MPRIEKLESGMWRVWVHEHIFEDFAFEADARGMLQHLEYEKVVDAMEQYGGSFVQQLAVLYRRADRLNQAKIRNTWSNYWEQYEKMSK